jgi:AraC-like DNA-binding protein
MTKRTLQRRLTEKGVGFSEIVDEVRQNMAIQYVEKSDISLTEVSFLLGYSHLSAFCRSFKRWTGTTPQKVRALSDS